MAKFSGAAPREKHIYKHRALFVSNSCRPAELTNTSRNIVPNSSTLSIGLVYMCMKTADTYWSVSLRLSDHIGFQYSRRHTWKPHKTISSHVLIIENNLHVGKLYLFPSMSPNVFCFLDSFSLRLTVCIFRKTLAVISGTCLKEPLSFFYFRPQPLLLGRLCLCMRNTPKQIDCYFLFEEYKNNYNRICLGPSLAGVRGVHLDRNFTLKKGLHFL